MLFNRDGSGMTEAQAQYALNKAGKPYYAHTYIPVGTTTTTITTTPGTPIKVSLDVLARRARGFTIADLGGGETSLRFIGEKDEAESIDFDLESSSGIETSVNNVTVEFMLYKNSVYQPGNIITRKVGTGADVGALALTGGFTGNSSGDGVNGDDLEVYVDSDIATTITFIHTSIVIAENEEI